MLLLHVLRYLEAAQCFDLPLRRAGPHTIRAPYHVIGTKPLDQRPQHGGGQARLGHHRPGEYRTQVAINVCDTVFGRDLGQISEPGEPAALLPFIYAVGWCSAEVAVTGMVDGKIELWPILGCTANVADPSVFGETRQAQFCEQRKEALVYADVLNAGLRRL